MLEGKMTNATTENFLQAWKEFQWPEPLVPSYRLYYNDDGTPKYYSMEDMPDKYVEVDAEIFAIRPWNVKVVDGKLIRIDPPVIVQKLRPGQQTGTLCDPRDVCVVVHTNNSHVTWNKTTNEIC
jgi:hypothetical protein